MLIALGFLASGVPQTLLGSVDATTLEGAKQTIALGPMAGQEAIKQIGTNGGGFFNANSAHPFENPNAFSNMLQIWAMMAVSTGSAGHLRQDGRLREAGLGLSSGRHSARRRRGRCLLGGNRRQSAADGARPRSLLGNMEGKEVRFGAAMSSLYAAVTTGKSCGAVNAMHDSLTPLGGLFRCS